MVGLRDESAVPAGVANVFAVPAEIVDALGNVDDDDDDAEVDGVVGFLVRSLLKARKSCSSFLGGSCVEDGFFLDPELQVDVNEEAGVGRLGLTPFSSTL